MLSLGLTAVVGAAAREGSEVEIVERLQAGEKLGQEVILEYRGIPGKNLPKRVLNAAKLKAARAGMARIAVTHVSVDAKPPAFAWTHWRQTKSIFEFPGVRATEEHVFQLSSLPVRLKFREVVHSE